MFFFVQKCPRNGWIGDSKMFFLHFGEEKKTPTSVRQRASTGAFLHVWEDFWFPQVF